MNGVVVLYMILVVFSFCMLIYHASKIPSHYRKMEKIWQRERYDENQRRIIETKRLLHGIR